jgi:Tfp pilus assembly protein PilX
MRVPRDPAKQRGSALLLVVVLLVVLSAIGVAAVAASSQERSNAAAKGRHDAMLACASAAQAEIWAELARYGPSYLASSVVATTVNLPDGTQVTAPGHYGASLHPPKVNVAVLSLTAAAGGANTAGLADLTNRPGGGTGFDQVHRIVATCKDARGNELEVELAVRLAL